MTIGENIRALRKKRGLTQKGLGALCGVSAGTISSYENGATLPKRRALEGIARALDVPVGKLAGSPAPAAPSQGSTPASDALLYDGVLTALKERYGIVEGRVILGTSGGRKKYYVVRQAAGDFILYEDDIAAIARAAKASITPVAEYMRLAQAAG